MKFNRYQIEAKKAYEGGEHSYVRNMSEVADTGDNLFRFVMNELSSGEECCTRERAVRRMDTALRQIIEVRDALSKEALS